MGELTSAFQVEIQSRRPRVVIVGGGFGGLHAAKALARLPVDVTVVDRRNHHTFQPLLYQVALAVLSQLTSPSPSAPSCAIRPTPRCSWTR